MVLFLVIDWVTGGVSDQGSFHDMLRLAPGCQTGTASRELPKGGSVELGQCFRVKAQGTVREFGRISW